MYPRTSGLISPFSHLEKLAPAKSPSMMRAYGKKEAQALGNAKRQEGTASGEDFHLDDTS
jgi:hypothetical protein